jgi:hypothetical protein
VGHDIDKQEEQTNRHVTMRLQTPNDILNAGFHFLGIRSNDRTNEGQSHAFHSHFGSKPLNLADMWYNLGLTTIPAAALTL